MLNDCGQRINGFPLYEAVRTRENIMPPEFPERREFECGRDGRLSAVPQIIGNPQTSAKLYDRLWFVYSLKLVEFSTSFFIE